MSDLLDVTEKINALRVARPVRELRPRFYRLEGEATELVPPGSVTVILGTRSATEDVERAVRSGDVGDINEVAHRANRAIQRFRRGFGAVERNIHDTSSFVDVWFGDQALARALTPDEQTFARVVHPYLGGGLDESRFSAAEYFQDGAERDELSVLIVTHEPDLDDVTRAVLERAATEGDVIRIGVDPDAVACTVTATPVVVAVTVAIVATAATSCAPSWNDREWWSNPDPAIADIAPRLAVEKLLAARAADFARPTR